MKKTLILLTLVFCAHITFAQYPVTKTVDSTHTYFGVKYKDPYEWLENFKDTSVVSWFKAQANLTNKTMNNITGRDELVAEWKMLDKLQPARISGRIWEHGRVFYRKTMPWGVGW